MAITVRVLVPSGALGLDWDAAAFEAGLAMEPDVIVIDGGSTDSGPHYLGTGTSKYSRATTKAQWAALMDARARADVPLVIGSAGTCGTDSTVAWLLDITREIAVERGERVRVATLESEQDADSVASALEAGRVRPLDPAPEIDAATLGDCTHIVALAGAEQIGAALASGAAIVIAGRTSDAASIAALPLARGVPPGPAWHGGKVGECGALCTTEQGAGSVMVAFDADGFTIVPLADGARATPRTVSAHMLYENADPLRLVEPGGTLDVSDARYEALDERRTRVTGARWVPADQYTVKLEGARRIGFQTASLVLVREPAYVAAIDAWCAQVTSLCRERAAARTGLPAEAFTVELRAIGAHATLGPLETGGGGPHEIGVLGIVTAPDQATANEIAKVLNPLLLHHALTRDEPMPTHAFPFSPPEMERGPAHGFALNHVLALDDPMEAFRLRLHEVGP